MRFPGGKSEFFDCRPLRVAQGIQIGIPFGCGMRLGVRDRVGCFSRRDGWLTDAKLVGATFFFPSIVTETACVWMSDTTFEGVGELNLSGYSQPPQWFNSSWSCGESLEVPHVVGDQRIRIFSISL